jgi:hypothetical protein
MRGQDTLLHAQNVLGVLILGTLMLGNNRLCSGVADAQTKSPPRSAPSVYSPASIRALPGMDCKLHAGNGSVNDDLALRTDPDGYARFLAVRGDRDAAHPLSLTCTLGTEIARSYPVDLRSAALFQPNPISLEQQGGSERPALKGDPMQFTAAQLIDGGYGIRPDPTTAPAAFKQWLEAASISARSGPVQAVVPRTTHTIPLQLTGILKKVPLNGPIGATASVHTITNGTQPWWVGTVLTGAADYVSSQATFTVPTVFPGAVGTTNTEMAIWNGLGGFSTGSGLIQGGVILRTTPTVAVYSTLREYCCGDTNENDSGIQAFTPHPGDKIFSEEWYCDKDGNENVNGGFGCTLIVDITTNAVLNCSKSTGSPCASVKASAGMVFGKSAEFIIENQSPQVGSSTLFPVFHPTVDMAGSAFSTKTNTWNTVSDDPSVVVLTESTNVPTHIAVIAGSANDTFFTWNSVWTPQQLGIGGGTSFGPSLAVFQNRLYAAWKGLGNDTRMFWSSFDGNRWSPQQVGIGGGSASGPSLAVFQGRLYAAWRGLGDDTRLFYSSFDGNSWSTQQIGLGGGSSARPALAVFQNGLYAAWKGLGSDERMFYSKFDGRGWSPQQVGVGGGSSNGPSLAVFHNRLYAGWKGLGTDTRMFYSSFDGTNWGPQQVGVGGGSSAGPSLTVFQDRLYAGWKGLGGDTRMFWSSFDGNVWGPQQVGVGRGSSNGPSLTVFQGQLYAAWKGIGTDTNMSWSFFQ